MTKTTSEGLWKAAGGFLKRNKSLLFLGYLTALAILATLAFAALITGGDENFTAKNRVLLPIGSEAPGFTAGTADGGSFSLEDAGDYEATMLVFFATWCPHCRHEAPIISELGSRYEDLRVVMVGVDARDSLEKVREFVESYDIEGSAVYEPSLASTYGVSGYPTIYVLGANGEVVVAHVGEAPREVYGGWIGAALGKNA